MSKLEEIKRAYGYNYRLDVNTYPFWLISRVEELESKLSTVLNSYKIAYSQNEHHRKLSDCYKHTLEEIKIYMETDAEMFLTDEDRFKGIHNALTKHYESLGEGENR